MKYWIPLFLILFILSCSGEKEHVVTEADIDAYVADMLDTSQIYDIVESLRFSREDEAYTVIEYSQSDTTILFNEEIETKGLLTRRNTFFKQGEPVYIEEYEFPSDAELPLVERKIYVNKGEVLKAYEKEGLSDEELELSVFKEVEHSIADYDFVRPKNAINQEGDYEMKFGEFLIIEPQRYLILENPISRYNVALFLMESDYLIEDLYNNPDYYEGRTIFIHHQFMNMNGIVRMIYLGGIVKE